METASPFVGCFAVNPMQTFSAPNTGAVISGTLFPRSKPNATRYVVGNGKGKGGIPELSRQSRSLTSLRAAQLLLWHGMDGAIDSRPNPNHSSRSLARSIFRDSFGDNEEGSLLALQEHLRQGRESRHPGFHHPYHTASTLSTGLSYLSPR